MICVLCVWFICGVMDSFSGKNATLLIHEATLEDGMEEEALEKRHRYINTCAHTNTHKHTGHCEKTEHFSILFEKIYSLLSSFQPIKFFFYKTTFIMYIKLKLLLRLSFFFVNRFMYSPLNNLVYKMCLINKLALPCLKL